MSGEGALASAPGPLRRWLAAAVLGLLACGAVVLARIDPAQPGRYPRCPMVVTTGLDCPGCGSLRGTHAFLNGRPLEGLRRNPALVLAFAAFGWLLVHEVALAVAGRRIAEPQLGPRAIWILFAAILIWFALRNLFPGLSTA